MSTAPQRTPHESLPGEERTAQALQVHHPNHDLQSTSEGFHLASMCLACAIFLVAFAGFVVLPYLAKWLAL